MLRTNKKGMTGFSILLAGITVIAIVILLTTFPKAAEGFKGIFSKNEGTNTAGSFLDMASGVEMVNKNEEQFIKVAFYIEKGYFLAKFDKEELSTINLDIPSDCNSLSCLVVCRDEKNGCVKPLTLSPFDNIDGFVIEDDEKNIILNGNEKVNILYFRRDGNKISVFGKSDEIEQQYQFYISSK